MELRGNIGDLTAALTALPLGVTLHDADGITIAANPCAGALLGVEHGRARRHSSRATSAGALMISAVVRW